MFTTKKQGQGEILKSVALTTIKTVLITTATTTTTTTTVVTITKMMAYRKHQKEDVIVSI
jgi:Tfp pilus assembly ATPase PilU